MQVFRELEIQAGADAMARTVAEIETSLPDDWKRDRDAENRANAIPVASRRVVYCFACRKTKRRPAALLALAENPTGNFCVSNIVPLENRPLDRAEYNLVLADFFERVFRPTAERLELEYVLTGAEAGLEQWMDSETSELLESFSESAHKGTGASLPQDRERWNAFVLSAHRNGSKLDPSTLTRWLVEVGGWPPEVAEQLALEYESGRELLTYAFAH